MKMQVFKVRNEIDDCLLRFVKDQAEDDGNKSSSSTVLSCRRATDRKEDNEKIHEYFASSLSQHKSGIEGLKSVSTSTSTLTSTITPAPSATAPTAPTTTTTPPHYIILCEERNLKQNETDENNENLHQDYVQLKGVLIWYFGYSTWKGKVMNVDCILFDSEEVQQKLLSAIVQIAKKFELGRIVYQIQGESNANLLATKYNFEILNEWLTLQMTTDKMGSFLETIHTWDAKLTNINISKKNDGTVRINLEGMELNVNEIHSCIDETLSIMNPAMHRRKNIHGRFQLKRAMQDDAKFMFNLVQGLAIYEKAPDEVEVNESTYQIDGSGDHPLYHCILIERCNENHDKEGGRKANNSTSTADNVDDDLVDVVGMGCFYFGYKKTYEQNINGDNSSGNERFLFLEDLFIQKEYRGNGYGKAIMYTLAQICLKTNCKRFVWQALDWNTPALNFYNSIGATVCDGLMTARFDKERIEGFQSAA